MDQDIWKIFGETDIIYFCRFDKILSVFYLAIDTLFMSLYAYMLSVCGRSIKEIRPGKRIMVIRKKDFAM